MEKQRPINKIKLLSLSCLRVFTVLVFQLRISEVCGTKCGMVDLLVPRISGGAETQKGEFPFLAALFYVEEVHFFCGGTIITTKHVLTAAHCVQNKSSVRKLLPGDVVVLLGAYNLSAKVERGVIQREVNDIHVHRDWKVYSDNYDADIAIFVLSKDATFTNYIRPVCLPADDAIYNGARGSIVGWGLADNTIEPHLESPRHAFTYALNASYCLTTDPYVAFLSSTRTFCGTGGNGAPNKGDSGGGFFRLSGSTWVQFGIISALRVNATGLIDSNSIAVYTNVKLFKNWINEIISNSVDVVTMEIATKTEKIATTETTSTTKTIPVSEVVAKSINLNCYDGSYYFGYSCEVPALDIRSENFEATNVNVFHISGKTDSDVQRIVFLNGTMIYLPDGIGNFFENLKIFVVSANLNFKRPRRSNFKNLKNLMQLHFYQNGIETLNENTLWDLPILEIFTLYKNKLKILHERTFEKNTKLREIDLRWNQLELLPKNLFKTNLLLQEAYFTGNSLKIILPNFSELKNILLLNFNDNVCINALYDSNLNSFEFNAIIRTNCSPVDP